MIRKRKLLWANYSTLDENIKKNAQIDVFFVDLKVSSFDMLEIKHFWTIQMLRTIWKFWKYI